MLLYTLLYIIYYTSGMLKMGAKRGRHNVCDCDPRWNYAPSIAPPVLKSQNGPCL